MILTEKAMAPHSSTLAWKIPWTEEPGRLQSMGSLRVGHDWATHFHSSLSCIGEGNGNPLQCSCLENPRDGAAWWAAVYGVTQSWTRLRWLCNSSSRWFWRAVRVEKHCSFTSWHPTHRSSCYSVAKSCLTLCDPMDCIAPGFPVLHHLPEFTQTQVHWFGDAIQPSHPLSPSFPPAFSLPQHQGLFHWVSSS